MEIKRYRKKPVEIEAVWWPGGEEAAEFIIEWAAANGCTVTHHQALPAYEEPLEDGVVLKRPQEPEHLAIDTLEGVMRATAGDWIIRGVKGEFYPCKQEVMELTYEAVTSGPIDSNRWRGRGRYIGLGNEVRPYGIPNAPVTGTVTRIWKVSPNGIWRLDIKTPNNGRFTAFAYAYEAVTK